ncbi:MAG: ABC transporter substrate-binding protein, partial [Acidimicrobiia bacterium]
MRRILPLATAVLILPLAFGPARAADQPTQGGEMVVTYKADVSTLDPAIGYDWQNWSMIKSLFDGLMDYKPGTTDLMPDLAESYDISKDGKTYTFKLRQGVKFHNGRELTADDLKWSIERAVRPETQSPGQGFFSMIAGFEDVASGKAKELSGIEVVDPYTLRFTLSRPDATFLHIMAINFSFAVPKEAVEEYGQDFGKHPVGTGAFRLTDWTLGQHLIFERNPDYYRDGLPRLDKITFEVGQEPLVALLRLQRGEVDLLGDPIPPAKFLEVMDDPEWSDNVVEGGQLQTSYVTMNVNLPPFDNPLVRQAV